jgi:hypothetical protein
MPLPLARPDANEVVLVAGRDPLDPARWLYTVERAGDGPGHAEVLESGAWDDLGSGVLPHEQAFAEVAVPAQVRAAGLAWNDAEVRYPVTHEGVAVRVSWRLPEEG